MVVPPLACPFGPELDICPNSVGPNTIAKFCTDIELTASCWLMLQRRYHELQLQQRQEGGPYTDANVP
jgi:hypothetical protein